MSTTSDQTLVVYSDYLCPFCYLGKESMKRYVDEENLSVDVEWRPFDIQGHKRGPDGEVDDSVEDGKDEAYFEQVRENVDRLKDEYDVEMQFDLPDDVDSWNAQKAALAIERNYDSETFHEFHEAVFVALWRDGRDIGDPEVLADVAEAAGVDPDEVRAAAENEELDAELERKFAEARRAGIRGIPTFVYDGTAAQGAIPPEQFSRLFEQD
ncbi:MAG: DsbA family protein [Bradymonadaceae bacterium]